jgi:predicted dinucleotide-binding enzyme
VLLTERSAAEDIAGWAPGSRVVKAFHLYPASQWSDPSTPPVTVPVVGPDPAALDVVSQLVADVGGRAVVIGGLDRARQLEEAAGFVIGLAFAGADPRDAVPHVPTGSVA